MSYRPGARSIAVLRTVHPVISAIAILGMRHSTVDFTVYHGLRSLDEQLANTESGVSRHSDPERADHVRGVAVDVVAAGVPDEWAERHYYPIAVGFARAAHELGQRLRWGGMWSDDLASWWHARRGAAGDEAAELRRARDAYVQRFRTANGRLPLADLVHFAMWD